MAQIKNISGESNTYMNKNMILSMVSLATKEIKGVIDVYQSTKLTLKNFKAIYKYLEAIKRAKKIIKQLF